MNSQLVKCTACGRPLCRIDARTMQVYPVDPERDSPDAAKAKMRANPGKKGKLPTPLFRLKDRKIKVEKTKDKDGIETEVTTEEPMTTTCLCGAVNKIY